MKQSIKGFTLVEMLVVAPIFILVSMTMLGFLIDRYGALLVNAARVRLVTEAQSMLITMEDELIFADDYLEALDPELNDPNDPFSGWDFDTDPDTLIISETALTSDRRDPDREFVYKASDGCATIALNNLIYFAVDNPDDDYYTLYKRTVAPDYATCGDDYKETSCPAAELGMNGCNKVDGEITNNLVDFQVEYYDEDGNLIDTGSGGSPLSGERVRVIVTLGDIAYGETIEETLALTMKKLN